tara:strand:+ start:2968 stop:3258 length:291 start_codon:yes stop_codon:yes gene_type:complete
MSLSEDLYRESEVEKRLLRPGEIEELCSHCDLMDDRARCPESRQIPYVFRKSCEYSWFEGVPLIFVSKDILSFNGVEYSRLDLTGLRKAIEIKNHT